jgi:plasmid stabilization system protein ParE
MSEVYHVIISDAALVDLEAITDYISLQSPQNAALVAERIVSQIDGLSEQPARFRAVGKRRSTAAPVHSIPVSSYVVYYSIEVAPRAVVVLTIRRGSRHQPKRFE